MLFFLIWPSLSWLNLPEINDDQKQSLTFSGPCCCGTSVELFYPNLDFEDGPIAPPGGWIDYTSGQNYGPWIVTSGSISIHAPDHGNLGAGNPNGSSQHLDLHGFNQGSVRYTLSGLTAGYMYTIEFWYAVHSAAGSTTASFRVGGGSLINANWSASNPGNVAWLKASYMFTATSSSTTMEFAGTGNTPCCGMLIDDIKIFECPSDLEKPEILNKPEDLTLDCLNELMPPEILQIQDNCDLNPMVVLEEKRNFTSNCELEVVRIWTISDQCKNSTTVSQIITISDKIPPQFTNLPQNKIVHCKPNIQLEFQNFLKNNADAMATDNCSTVKFSYSYDTLGIRPCDSTLVDFVIEDNCGNTDLSFAWFIIIDTIKPEIYTQAKDLILPCGTQQADSIIKDWITKNGLSWVGDVCGYLRTEYKYLPIIGELQPVEFVFTDRCGNKNSTTANIIRRDGSDTTVTNQIICGLSAEYSDTTLTQKPGGCDSLSIVKYIPANTDSMHILIQICDSAELATDTIFLQNQYGCDSLIIREKNLNQSIYLYETVFLCDTGRNDTVSIRYPALPCDSIKTIFYVKVKSDVNYIFQTSCDSTEAGIDSLLMSNQHGCDSLVIVETEFSKNEKTFIDSAICGLTLEFSDTLLLSGHRCDSLVIRNFKSLKEDTFFISKLSCNPLDTGIFKDHLINQFGCDSVVISEIRWSPSYFKSDTQLVCSASDSEIVNSRFSTFFGCDSIVQMVKVYQKPQPKYTILYTCSIDSIGKDSFFLSGQFCDSIAIVEFKLFPAYETKNLNRTCFPDSVGLDTTFSKSQFGCDSLIIDQKEYIPIEFEIIKSDITCFGNSDGKIEIRISKKTGREKYFINGNESGSNLNLLSQGSYLIQIQDSFGCLSDSTLIQIEQPKVLTVDAGADLLINKNEPVLISGISNRPILSANWIPDIYFDCSGCLQTKAKFDKDTVIKIIVVDSNGCTAEDFLLVRIIKNKNVFAPNVISVNDDQVNDRFYFIGDEGISVKLLQIYDRWGNLIFSIQNTPINDPNQGWNGYFKNQKVTPGVYTFYAELVDNENQIIKKLGEITIIR